LRGRLAAMMHGCPRLDQRIFSYTRSMETRRNANRWTELR
jgi:hypothetical protein